MSLPKEVRVAKVISSRYPAESFKQDSWFVSGTRKPLSWDQRVAGLDTISTTDGETLKLKSEGDQSVPDVGWVILLTGGDNQSGFAWTLYGIPPSN